MSIVSGILPGRLYEFRVAAYNGVPRAVNAECDSSGADGWSRPSQYSVQMTTLPEPPEAPNAPTCTAPQGKQLFISWQPNFDNGANITSYTIFTNATNHICLS